MKRLIVPLLLLGWVAITVCLAGQVSFDKAMDEGRAHLQSWRNSEAQKSFQAALGQAPDSEARTEALLQLAHTAYFSGSYAAARKGYAEARSVDGISRDAEFYSHQFTGHSYLQEGRYAEALEAYKEAEQGTRPTLARNARNDILFTYRDAVTAGVSAYRLGDMERAEAALRSALELEGLPARQACRAWLTLGQIYAARDDPGQAKAAFQKVLEEESHAPDFWLRSEALLAMAELHKKKGLPDQAHEFLEKVLNLQVHAHPRHRLEVGETLGRSGGKFPSLSMEYGAKINPTGSPIGGGEGYAEIFLSGDIEVENVEELRKALEGLAKMETKERLGKVVYVRPEAEIELSGGGISVPSGVTLAGNRGAEGACGPLLFCDEPPPSAMIQMSADARLTGLRLRGDGPAFHELFSMWPHDYYSAEELAERGISPGRAVAVAVGDRARVDNCEISRFARGVTMHSSSEVRIQHNAFHDISPYPIVTDSGTFNPLLEANIIDWAWHGVATSDNMTASFTARYNLVRETSPNLLGQGMSGTFGLDHHGQGEYFLIHHNTFEHMDPSQSVPGRSIALAPVWDSARIYGNHFVDYMTAEDATFWEFQRPFKNMTDLKEIVTRRDLSSHMKEYLNTVEDFSNFDMREIVAMSRGGGGGENLWIFDNAYGPDAEVLDLTIFTTPRIFLQQPAHRKVRTRLGAGRGGETHPALHHLHGLVPLVLEVEAMPPLEITKVTIDLIVPENDRLFAGAYSPSGEERQQIYSGEKAPKPGEVVLDTTELDNGTYGIIVTAEDNRGISSHHMTFFEVVNPR